MGETILAVLIHCDSTTTIAKVQNRYYNGKRQQICCKHSTVRDLSNGVVKVDHIQSNDNLANSIAKILAREKVWKIYKGWHGAKPIDC